MNLSIIKKVGHQLSMLFFILSRLVKQTKKLYECTLIGPKKKVLLISLLIGFTSLIPLASAKHINTTSIDNQQINSNNINSEISVLLMVPNYFGPLTFQTIDIFESYGWNITTCGVSQELNPCPGSTVYWEIPTISVDILIDQVIDISRYNALCIMHSSKWAENPPCEDLIGNKNVLDLIKEADQSGLILASWCSSVRVLAAADVIQGKNVTGAAEFASEYEAAGARYLGDDVYPVVNDRIITCGFLRRYILDMCEEISIAIDQYQHLFSPKSNCGSKTEYSLGNYIGGPHSDGLRSIIPASDDGFILCGYSFSYGSGSSDVFLVKTNSIGEQVWQRTFGGQHMDYGNCVTQTKDGGYILCGYTSVLKESLIQKDVYVIRTDANGQMIWNMSYGGPEQDEGLSIIETSEGDFVITGFSELFHNGMKDIFLLKINADGELVWEKFFGGGVEINRGNHVIETNDGGYLITGSSSSGTYDIQGYLMKTNANGEKLWEKQLECNQVLYSWGLSACEMINGDILTIGHGRIGNIDLLNLIITYHDSHGNLLWSTHTGESSGFDYGNAIAVGIEDKAFICGSTRSKDYGNDLMLLSIDSIGTISDKNIIGGIGCESGTAISFKNQGLVVGGYANTEETNQFDMFIWMEANDENEPPYTPQKPEGPTSGKVGTDYSFFTLTSDPDNDSIFYKFSWGDGLESEWIGPYLSNQGCHASHTWITRDTFSVRVKARDSHNEESDWSEPLTVKMPRSIHPFNLTHELFRIFEYISQIIDKKME